MIPAAFFAVALVVLEPSVSLFSIGVFYTLHGPIEWLWRRRSGNPLEVITPAVPNEPPQG